MKMKLSGERQQSFHWKTETAPAQHVKLSAGETKITNGYWGRATLNSRMGSQYAIHLFDYKLSQPADFVIVSNNFSPVIVISWENEFALAVAGLGAQLYPPKHFNLLNAPSGEFEVQFKQKGNYQLLLISVTNTLLDEYGDDCPPLHSFISNPDRKMSAALINKPFVSSHAMIEVIFKIINCNVQSSLCGRYYDLLIRELLTLLADRINPVADQTLPMELKYAEKARQLIVQDFEIFHTVKQLARLCGTNDVVLQRAFKTVYGDSVGKYSRQVRLAEAYRLLSETDYPLRIICTMVGYNEAPNFFTAFKRQYGVAPGKIQQRGKDKPA